MPDMEKTIRVLETMLMTVHTSLSETERDAIRTAVALLKEQEAEISFLKGMQLKTIHNMSDEDIGDAVAELLRLERR